MQVTYTPILLSMAWVGVTVLGQPICSMSLNLGAEVFAQGPKTRAQICNLPIADTDLSHSPLMWLNVFGGRRGHPRGGD